VVNARLKHLLQHARRIPGKREWDTELELFLYSVEDAVEEACLGKNIRKSFSLCGLEPFDPEQVLKKVPETLSEEVTQRLKESSRGSRNLFDINCKCLTDNDVLHDWEQHDAEILVSRKKKTQQTHKQKDWGKSKELEKEESGQSELDEIFVKRKRKRVLFICWFNLN
jgi:hypothetical protein